MNARLTPLVVVGERISSSSVRWEGPKLSRLRIQPSPRILTYSSFFFKYRTYIYWRGCALCVRWIFSYTFMANARTRCTEIDKKKKNGPSLCEWMCVCLFGCKVSSFSLPPSHFHHKCFGSHLFPLFLCGSAWLCHFEGVRWSIRV